MIFVDINVYMEKSKAERKMHLILNESCIEIGGNSTEFRAVLAYQLGTTIPKGMKIHCCHACNNGNCSNPKHLYWGTAKENQDDSNVRGLAQLASKGKIPWNKGQSGLVKHTPEVIERMKIARRISSSQIRNPSGKNQFG